MMLNVKRGFERDYFAQGEALGEAGIHEILNAGRAWDIAPVLEQGGSAIFPHTYLDACGDQIAAVVHGCLDSGADQVLVLGVVHTGRNEELKKARVKEMRGEDITSERYWGVFPEFKGEYSLFYFKTLWEAEVKRRGITPPRLIERYPCLVHDEPHNLLGIEELQRIAKDSAVVVTGDLVHHGVAYKTERHLERGYAGEVLAREKIAEAFEILKKKDYKAFREYCYLHRNDSRDVCTVLDHLLGPLDPHILDLRLVSTADLFEGAPTPSWVAASLVALHPSGLSFESRPDKLCS